MTGYIKYLALFGMIYVTSVPCRSAELSFEGNTEKVISEVPDKSTGLDMIYVVSSVNGLSASFASNSPGSVTWYRYGNLGGGYAEELYDVTVGNGFSRLDKVEGDMGYIVEQGDERYYFWVTDYSHHELRMDSLIAPAEQDCGTTVLEFSGDASAIHYYTINGRQMTLPRDIMLSYVNLVWSEESSQFIQEEINTSEAEISSSIYITPAVTCSTIFELSGDRFLREWNREKHVESTLFSPTAVDCRTEAVQTSSGDDDELGSNKINTGNQSALGGSAPAEITFYSYVTDAVVHNEWQISTDQDFENITHRITEQDLTYTFEEEGTLYVRFIGSNSDGSCETFGDTYEVMIGASELRIPNAFSPDGDGVNDIWRIAYRSLLDFKCWIYDRNGNQLYYFDDPSGGWDGTKNGKKVKPGVYYYVIQATGSDGKKYKKGGDINIMVRKNASGQNSGAVTE